MLFRLTFLCGLFLASLFSLNSCASDSPSAPSIPTPSGGGGGGTDASNVVDEDCNNGNATCTYKIDSLEYHSSDTTQFTVFNSANFTNNLILGLMSPNAESFDDDNTINVQDDKAIGNRLVFRIKSSTQDKGYYYLTEDGNYIIPKLGGYYFSQNAVPSGSQSDNSRTTLLILKPDNTPSNNEFISRFLGLDTYQMLFVASYKFYTLDSDGTGKIDMDDDGHRLYQNDNVLFKCQNTSSNIARYFYPLQIVAPSPNLNLKIVPENGKHLSSGETKSQCGSNTDNYINDPWTFTSGGYFTLNITRTKTVDGKDQIFAIKYIIGNYPGDAPENTILYNNQADDFIADYQEAIGDGLDDKIILVDKDHSIVKPNNTPAEA